MRVAIELSEPAGAVGQESRADTLLRAVLDEAPIGMAVYDLEHRLQFINAEMARLRGVPAEVQLGKRVVDSLPGPSGDGLIEGLDLAAQVGPLFDLVEAGSNAVGEPIATVTSYLPLHRPDGVTFAVACIVRDVTRERRAARERESFGEKRQAVAEALARSLLPPALPQIEGLEIAARYRGAER